MKTLKTQSPLLSLVLITAFALSFTALPALAAEEGTVNINDAEQSQLSLLPRVGPALAGRISEFREENGKFKSTDDLMLVRGIGEKTMELIRPFVTTSGKTTLTSKVSISRAQEAAAAPKKDKGGKSDGKNEEKKAEKKNAKEDDRN